MVISLRSSSQIVLFKRLSTMVAAGIPIVEALHMIEEGERHNMTRRAINALTHSVSEGVSIADSLHLLHGISHETIVLIDVGVRSSSLHRSLRSVSDMLQARRETMARVRGAMIYPGIILLATVGITIFLIAYLFPKLTPVFRSMHSTLPFSTRCVLVISDLITQHWFILTLGIVAMCIALWFLSRIRMVRNVLDVFILRVPILGSLLVAQEVATSSRIAAAMLGSGGSLVSVYSLLSRTTKNSRFNTLYIRVVEQVNSGIPLAKALRNGDSLIPPFVIHMIMTGESTGTLRESYELIVSEYEREIVDITRNMTTLIEPLLMIVMGGVVGFIALSIIAPIYQLTESMHG